MLLLLCMLPITAAAQSNFTDTTAALDKLLQPWANPIFPGVSVAVSRNGQLLYSKAFGSADLEHNVPNTTQTIFEAGSVSKQFTAAAVLLLAADKKLNIQDDIRLYVPEIPNYGKPILIYDLIHHQSGLRDWGSVAAVEGWERGTRYHTNQHALKIIARQKALNNPPGTEYIYSNSNYNLMAIIVERVSGQPFAKFCQQRIFIPAGMEHTSWRNDYKQVVKNRAIAYNAGSFGAKMNMPFEDAHGNGGLLTTAEDLVKWAEFMNTGKLGGQDLLQEQLAKAVFRNGQQHSYAAGLRIDSFHNQLLINHSGATAGYRANLDYFPASGLAIAILSNTSAMQPVALGQKLATVFFPAARTTPAAPTVAPRFTAETRVLEQNAGLYRSNRNDELVRVTANDGGLIVNTKDTLRASADGIVYTGGYQYVFSNKPGKKSMLRITRYAPIDTVAFVSVSAARIDSLSLKQFAGRYFSEETMSFINVSSNAKQLVLEYLSGEKIVVNPVYEDGFQHWAGAVRFERAPNKSVKGFYISVDRARKIWFEKIR